MSDTLQTAPFIRIPRFVLEDASGCIMQRNDPWLILSFDVPSGLDMVFYHIQLRTYCKTPQALWTSKGHCSLHREIRPADTDDFLEHANKEVTPGNGELVAPCAKSFESRANFRLDCSSMDPIRSVLDGLSGAMSMVIFLKLAHHRLNGIMRHNQ
jgi:hypothetical protein